MKRREIVRNTLVGSSLLSIKSWIPPTVVAVSLPAHAQTSETLYSGRDSSPSAYAILRDWMGTATQNADGSVSMAVQNIENTVRVAVIIDEIGPASPGYISTSCTNIGDMADAGVTAISSSDITLGIIIQVLGTMEVISITLPLANNAITFPPLEPTCILS